MKIRTRLALRFTFLVASLLMLFSLAVYLLYGLYRRQEFRERLEVKARMAGELWVHTGLMDLRTATQTHPRSLVTMVEELTLVYAPSGELVFKSQVEDVWDLDSTQVALVRQEGYQAFESGARECVAVTHQTAGGIFVLAAVAHDVQGWEKLDRLRFILMSLNLTALLIVALAGYMFAGSALKPVSDMVLQVKQMSPDNLKDRVAVRGEDELALLARTFNHLLDRVQEVFDLQKSFVSGASHELRTPMSVIYTELEVSLMKAQSREALQESIGRALEEMRKLIGMTNSLLNMVRLSEQHEPLKMVRLRVDEVVLSAISMQQQKYPAQEIELFFEDNIEDEADLIALGNEALIFSALNNLIDNACKYSGQKTVTVWLSSYSDHIHIRVEDRGDGIPAEDLQRITLPFYRGSNVQQQAGYGIGLALVQKIAQLHGGKLKIYSKIGEGTTAVITLPIAHSR